MRIERVSSCCGSRGSLAAIDFQPHAKPRNVHRLATASATEVQIWALWRPEGDSVPKNPIKCVCLFTFKGHAPYEVSTARWSPNGRYLASTDSGGVTHILERNEEKSASLEISLRRVMESMSNGNEATVPEDVQPVVTREVTKYTFKYDGASSKKARITLEQPSREAGSKGTRISIESKSVHKEVIKPTTIHNSSGNYEIWTHLQPIRCPAKMGQLFDISWAPDNRSIVGGGLNGRVAVFDIHTKQIVAKFDAFEGIRVENEYNVRGYVKSVAWDPMTLFVAVQTSNRHVSVWRRSPPHPAGKPYKWTFKRVLYEEELFKKTQCDVLGGSRISWTPNGQAICFPNAGVGINNFAACFEVVHADVSHQTSLVAGEKIDRSKLQFVYDIADHNVRPDPLLLLGHTSRVRNVRFSQDLLVSYKRGLCKGGTLADSDRFIYYAQTSDDGIVSIWRFKQSSNWYSHYKNEAHCICVIQNVTDEQSSMEDIAWGNSGKWLAIGTSQGGLIMIEMGEEETFTRYRSNWMLGVEAEDTHQLDMDFMDMVDKYLAKKAEESKSGDGMSPLLNSTNDIQMSYSICDIVPNHICSFSTSKSHDSTCYYNGNMFLRNLSMDGFMSEGMPGNYFCIPRRHLIIMNQLVIYMFYLIVKDTLEALYCIAMLLCSLATPLLCIRMNHHGRPKCGMSNRITGATGKGYTAGYRTVLSTDIVGSMYTNIMYDITSSPYVEYEDGILYGGNSRCIKSLKTIAKGIPYGIHSISKMIGLNSPSFVTCSYGINQDQLGSTIHNTVLANPPDDHYAQLCSNPSDLASISQSQNTLCDAFRGDGSMATPTETAPNRDQQMKNAESLKRKSRSSKRKSASLNDDMAVIDIWLNMDYSNVEELLAEHWINLTKEGTASKAAKNIDKVVSDRGSQKKMIVLSTASDGVNDVFENKIMDDIVGSSPKTLDSTKTPLRNSDKPSKTTKKMIVETEKNGKHVENVFSPPCFRRIICIVASTPQGRKKIFATNNINNDVPATISCIEHDANGGFQIKWMKNVAPGFVTHMSPVKSAGVVLVIGQVGECLNYVEGNVPFKRKRWSTGDTLVARNGDKGISKRHINQETASYVTIMDSLTGETVSGPYELRDTNVSSVYAFSSGDRMLLAFTAANDSISLYSLDGLMMRKDVQLRLMFTSRINSFLPSEKYGDIMQIQLLNITMNAAADGRSKENLPFEESYSPLKISRADVTLEDIHTPSMDGGASSSVNRKVYMDTKTSSNHNDQLVSSASSPSLSIKNPLGALATPMSHDIRSGPIPVAPFDTGISLDMEPDNNMYAIMVYLRDPEVYVLTKFYDPIRLELGKDYGNSKNYCVPRDMLSLKSIRELYKRKLNGESIPEKSECGYVFNNLINRLVGALKLNHLITDKYNNDIRYDGLSTIDQRSEYQRFMESALIIGSRSEYTVHLYEYMQRAFSAAAMDEIANAVITLYKTYIEGVLHGWNRTSTRLSAFDSRMITAIGIDVIAIINHFILPLLRSMYEALSQECGNRNLYIVDTTTEVAFEGENPCHPYCTTTCPISEAKAVIENRDLTNEDKLLKVYNACGDLLKNIDVWEKIISQF